ncbi:MAG: hypothetical protein P8R42_20095 [Candidatus Binatia bacterium]|nr:hypothetical protein [Candidatus Binatia bacterium]
MQKTVEGNEWTITYEIATGHVTGNVRGNDFSAFVECDRLRVDREEGLEEFECHWAEGCRQAPCVEDPWQPVGEVQLPLSFFFPPEPEPGDEPLGGCCDFGPGGPCFPIDFSPSGCIGAGGTARGGTCTVLGPMEDCPPGLESEFCFVGECR